MLARAWAALIQPWWPRVRDVLDADITYRARRLADAGVAATLNELDPRVSWHDEALRFAHSDTTEMDLPGGDLVLIPSVFTWPHCAVSYDPPAVIYPARGIGDICAAGPRSDEDLARLIGRARAVLLAALADRRASTTGLAARTRIPVSSVSEHLAILRAAGLSHHHQNRPLPHAPANRTRRRPGPVTTPLPAWARTTACPPGDWRGRR